MKYIHFATFGFWDRYLDMFENYCDNSLLFAFAADFKLPKSGKTRQQIITVLLQFSRIYEKTFTLLDDKVKAFLYEIICFVLKRAGLNLPSSQSSSTVFSVNDSLAGSTLAILRCTV